MKPKQCAKILADALVTVDLLILMGYHFWGDAAHEWGGRGLPAYLFAQAEFVFLDYGEPKVLFYLDYLAMMGTFIFLAHYAAKLLKGAKRNQKP